MDTHVGSHMFHDDLYRSDRITRYVVPFVIGMLLARDSIIGISIPSSISLLESLFTRSVIHHPATNIACKAYSDVHYREGPDIPL